MCSNPVCVQKSRRKRARVDAAVMFLLDSTLNVRGFSKLYSFSKLNPWAFLCSRAVGWSNKIQVPCAALSGGGVIHRRLLTMTFRPVPNFSDNCLELGEGHKEREKQIPC